MRTWELVPLALCLLAATMTPVAVRANTALDDGWCPLPYDTCTDPTIPGEERTGPPYSGANADPLIAEGVSSGSVGNTCNFRADGQAFPEMPQLYKDNWLLAASQDLYNGRHLGENTWAEECDVSKLTWEDADTGANLCGAACGVCFLVSGENGAGVFMVNEIADIGAVGQNGRGLNLHLDDDHNGEVRGWGGASKDIRYKRVPCPVGESGISIHTWNVYSDSAVFLVILNHRNGIKSVHARGGPGGNQTWVPMARDWTNRWRWESYGCEGCPPFQEGAGPIQRGSTDNDFELLITDVFGGQVHCRSLQAIKEGPRQTCVDEEGQPLQLSCGGAQDEGGVALEGCDGSTPLNMEYYVAGELESLDVCGEKDESRVCGTRPAGGSSASSLVSLFLSLLKTLL